MTPIKRFSRSMALTLLVIAIVLLLLPVSFSWAADNKSNVNTSRELFNQANTLYEKGDFEQAIALYQQILAGGYDSGNLYYNLGNAYFKIGKRGSAILYYRKAKRLTPGDADLKANLSFVLNAAGENNQDWMQNLKDTVTGLSPLRNLFFISSFFFFLVAAILIMIILFPARIKDINSNKLKPFWLWFLIVSGGLLVISVSITTFTCIDQVTPQAVVIRSGGTVHFEPKADATIYYSLNEGAKVYILSKQNDWSLIKRQDGKRGWIENSFLDTI